MVPQFNTNITNSKTKNYLLKAPYYFYMRPTYVMNKEHDLILGSFESKEKAKDVLKEWTRKMYSHHVPHLCLHGYNSEDSETIKNMNERLQEFKNLMNREFENAKSNLYRIPDTASNNVLDKIYDILRVDYFKIVKPENTGKYSVEFNYGFWGDWIFDISYYCDNFSKTEFETYEEAYKMGIYMTQWNWANRHGETPYFGQIPYKEMVTNIEELNNLMDADKGVEINYLNWITIQGTSIDNLMKLEKILITKPFEVIKI